jgi:hypothetical protein
MDDQTEMSRGLTSESEADSIDLRVAWPRVDSINESSVF